MADTQSIALNIANAYSIAGTHSIANAYSTASLRLRLPNDNHAILLQLPANTALGQLLPLGIGRPLHKHPISIEITRPKHFNTCNRIRSSANPIKAR